MDETDPAAPAEAPVHTPTLVPAMPEAMPAPDAEPAPAPAAPLERRTVEQWAAAKKTPAWLLAAACAHAFGHAHGRDVTEPEFDAACAAAGALPLR